MKHDGRWLKTLSDDVVTVGEEGRKYWEVCGMERRWRLAWDLYMVSWWDLEHAETRTLKIKLPRSHSYASVQVLQIGARLFVL